MCIRDSFNCGRGRLWNQLQRGFAWWRWLEYSASASLMLLSIAAVMAIREVYTLVSIFVLCFTTMYCGLETERFSSSSEKASTLDRLAPHLFGYLPYFAAWLPIIVTYHLQVKELCTELYQSMPKFVTPLVWGTFVIFSLFAVVQMAFQCVESLRKTYWRSEVAYCILSLTAKSYLGGFLLTNVIMKAAYDASESEESWEERCNQTLLNANVSRRF